MESREDTARDGSTSPSVLRQAFNYLYVAVWVYTYWIRTTFVAAVLRRVLVFLGLIELVSPWWHFYFPTESLPRAWKLIFAVTLFVVVVMLSINHRRLTVRLQRHDVILSSIRLLLEEGVLDDRDGVSPHDRVAKVLTALVSSIEYGRRGNRMNATVMIRSATDRKFRIAAQDSHRKFDSELSLDGNCSVAGRAATGPPEVVIYVPNTRFVHGVQIDLLKTFPKREYFRATEIVAGAFEWLDATNQSLVRSLVCMRVPTSTGLDTVLCVSGQRTNSLGYLELSAIKVAAGLVAEVLKA
jgi:hypothetical protein